MYESGKYNNGGMKSQSDEEGESPEQFVEWFVVSEGTRGGCFTVRVVNGCKQK